MEASAKPELLKIPINSCMTDYTLEQKNVASKCVGGSNNTVEFFNCLSGPYPYPDGEYFYKVMAPQSFITNYINCVSTAYVNFTPPDNFNQSHEMIKNVQFDFAQIEGLPWLGGEYEKKIIINKFDKGIFKVNMRPRFSVADNDELGFPKFPWRDVSNDDYLTSNIDSSGISRSSWQNINYISGEGSVFQLYKPEPFHIINRQGGYNSDWEYRKMQYEKVISVDNISVYGERQLYMEVK